MDVDSQPTMDETILVGDDLMTGPPSPVVPPEIASHVLQGVDLCDGLLRNLFLCLQINDIEPFCQEEIALYKECAERRDKVIRKRLQDSELKLGLSMPLDEAKGRASQLEAEVTSLERRLILASGAEGIEGFRQRWSLHGRLTDSKNRLQFFSSARCLLEELRRAKFTMDASRIDIFEIYRRYSDIKSGHAYIAGEEGYRQDSDVQKAKFSRDALTQLSKLVESRVMTGGTIFDEISVLMSHLGLRVDFAEFSRFYDFVFFMCRENGQKNITVSRAVTAWKLVLAGQFSLLHPWCDFVEKNQRYNISEDTWQQVLAFSWCSRENLEAYDPEGAWPVLIDDFVEHMYRMQGSYYDNSNIHCKCGDPESQSCVLEDSLPGRSNFSGVKRKLYEDFSKNDHMDANSILFSNCKKSRPKDAADFEDYAQGNTAEDFMETSTQNSPLCSSMSPCAVEGILSKGFAGLLSTRSYVQFSGDRRASF